MTDDLPQPHLDQMSSLAALVLLAYGLVRIINLPTLSADVVIAGLVIPLTINTRLIMLSLAAALAVVGADWLVRSHPRSSFDGPPVRHWIVPGLAALGVGGLLTRLPQGLFLWLGLAAGAGLLLAVFVGEFVAVESTDRRFGAADLSGPARRLPRGARKNLSRPAGALRPVVDSGSDLARNPGCLARRPRALTPLCGLHRFV